MKTIRVATVRETGKRYVVQQLCFRTYQAHCWGEVVDVRRNIFVHDGSVSFQLAEVKVEELPLSAELATELWSQSKEARATRERRRREVVNQVDRAFREVVAEAPEVAAIIRRTLPEWA